MDRSPDDAKTLAFQDRLLEWFSAAGLKEEAEADEWTMLNARAGSLDRRQTVAASWRIEGAAVLVWALGHADLPSHDSSATAQGVLAPLGFMSAGASRQFIASARLRHDSDLYHAYNRLWQIDWRLVEYRLRPSLVDLREMEMRHDWWGRLDIPDKALGIDGDLVVGGKPIHEADPQAIALANQIAVERHHAANWLIGLGHLYSEIAADT